MSSLIDLFSRLFLPKVRDLMTKDVITLDPKASAFESFTIMVKHEIGSLIITEEGKPVGILTRRDLMNRVFFKGLDFKQVKVGDAMTTPLFSVHPSDNVIKVLELIEERDITRAAVLDKEKLVGIITKNDIRQGLGGPFPKLYGLAYFLWGVLVTLVFVYLYMHFR